MLFIQMFVCTYVPCTELYSFVMDMYILSTDADELWEDGGRGAAGAHTHTFERDHASALCSAPRQRPFKKATLASGEISLVAVTTRFSSRRPVFSSTANVPQRSSLQTRL